MAKKTPKSKKKSEAKPADSSLPQIIAMKGGLTAAQFMAEVNAMMDEPLARAQVRDLQLSIEAVVEKELSEGNPVNLFGLVKIAPRLHTKGERMVNKEFGNPDSPKVKKVYKAKTSFKSGQGIFTKKVKDAMPSAQKLAKRVAG